MVIDVLRQYVMEEYPEAVIEYEINKTYDKEILFLPYTDADGRFSCTEINGEPMILTEFCGRCVNMGHWIAKAQYTSGKRIEEKFFVGYDLNPLISKSDQMETIKDWLFGRNEPPCYYSIRWINNEEEE